MPHSRFTVRNNLGSLLKRLPQEVNLRHDISNYSIDNLYPQRIHEILIRSPICLSAVQVKRDFLGAEGFDNNGEEIANERLGLEWNDLLVKAASDFAQYNGFAMHLNINLLGEVVDAAPVDFENVRFGLPDENGKITNVKISLNWEQDPRKFVDGPIERIFKFPIWPGTPEKAIEVMNEFNGDFVGEFPGFILYWTPEKFKYPRCSFDAALDSVQTNAEVQTFELSSIQNGFLGATLFKHEGLIESDDERGALMDRLSDMKGAANANSVLLVETPEGFAGDILETFPALNNDTLFNLTNINVIDRIINSFGMPFAVLGIQPQNTGIFNQEQIKDSFVFYNQRTRRERQRLERVFNRLGEALASPLEFGDILNLEFEGTKEPEPAPAAPVPPPPPEPEPPE